MLPVLPVSGVQAHLNTYDVAKAAAFGIVSCRQQFNLGFVF